MRVRVCAHGLYLLFGVFVGSSSRLHLFFFFLLSPMLVRLYSFTQFLEFKVRKTPFDHAFICIFFFCTPTYTHREFHR